MPFGTYYDFGERFERVRLKLQQDIFPLIKLIEALTTNENNVRPYLISYDGNFFVERFHSLNFKELEIMVMSTLYTYNTDDLDLCLNMNFQSGSFKWQTQFLVKMDCIRIYDEDGHQEYPVWHLWFGNIQESFYETLDALYSDAMLSSIIKWAVDLIKLDYDYEKRILLVQE